MDDPYETLGIARDPSQECILQAYCKLAKKHHPDLNPGDAQAEDRFKAVSAANGLLSDPDKRGRFDRGEIDADGQEQAAQPFYNDPFYRGYAEGVAGRRYGPAGRQQGQEGFDDIFGSMFSGGLHGRRGSGNAAMQGQDERYVLTASFLDAVAGATRRLTLPDGRTLDVKIPPASSDGQVLRLRGRGVPAHGGQATGDLYATLRVVIGTPDPALEAFLRGPVAQQAESGQPDGPQPMVMADA